MNYEDSENSIGQIILGFFSDQYITSPIDYDLKGCIEEQNPKISLFQEVLFGL